MQRARGRAHNGGFRPFWRFLELAVAALCGGLVTAALMILVPAQGAARLIQHADARHSSLVAAEQLPPQPAPAQAGLVAAEDPQAALPAATGYFTRPFTVLLLGVDRRPNPADGVRSDTMLVAWVDPQAPAVSLLAIPRDTVVTIPSFGWSKINAAYSLGFANAEALYGAGTSPEAGGAALAATSVEQFLQVPIDYTAQVDFQGFEALVDAIGGITVDVPAALVDHEYPTDDYGVTTVSIGAGQQVMDGRTALIYVRSRHGSDDFDRGRRQQQVLRAGLAAFRERNTVEQLGLVPALLDVAGRTVRTTLPIGDQHVVADLLRIAGAITPEQVATQSISPDDVTLQAQDGSDLYWAPQEIAMVVARWRMPPDLRHEQAHVQIVNGTTADGVAGMLSQSLAQAGFLLDPPASTGYAVPTTQIYVYRDAPATVAQLAAALNLPPSAVVRPAPDDAPGGAGADIVVVVGTDYDLQW